LQEISEAMRTNFFFRTAAAAFVLAAACVTASAQVATLTGKVTLKQEDGTQAPVADAVVDIYRTDISQKFQTKTNKRGEFTHAGIQLVGTYTIAVSAPGARPDFVPNVRGSAQAPINFDLLPGDGSRLTQEQIKTAARPSGGSGGGGAPAADSAAAKKAKEEYEKEHPNTLSQDVDILKEQVADIQDKIKDALTAARERQQKAGTKDQPDRPAKPKKPSNDGDKRR